MMEPLGKTVDFLLKKNWIAIILSFVTALVIHIFVPTQSYDDNVYNKLPFGYSINVIIVFIAEVLILFMIFHGIQKAILFAISHKKRKSEESAAKSFDEVAHQEMIEKFKAMADKWSDMDFSIVMYLLSSENRKPYVTGYVIEDSILNRTDFFYSTTEYKPTNIFPHKGAIPVGMFTQPISKYLMTQSFYNICKMVIDRTGSLSHFERSIIDLHQEQF